MSYRCDKCGNRNCGDDGEPCPEDTEALRAEIADLRASLVDIETASRAVIDGLHAEIARSSAELNSALAHWSDEKDEWVRMHKAVTVERDRLREDYGEQEDYVCELTADRDRLWDLARDAKIFLASLDTSDAQQLAGRLAAAVDDPATSNAHEGGT